MEHTDNICWRFITTAMQINSKFKLLRKQQLVAFLTVPLD